MSCYRVPPLSFARHAFLPLLIPFSRTSRLLSRSLVGRGSHGILCGITGASGATSTLLEDRRVEVRPHIVGAATVDILPGVIADMAREHAALVQEIRAPVLHLLREAMHDAAFHEASRRRRDMRGLADVDRDCLAALWARVPKPEQPTLRFLMQGAAILHRSTRGRTSPTCPWEDECHRYWVCPRWSPLRVDKLGAEHHEISVEIARLGTVAATCGIPTQNITANLKSRWPDICSCMVAIHRAATPEGGDDEQ